MKKRRQESNEHGKEYRKVCNVVRKAARTDKKDWLQEQCQEIERCAEGNISRKVYKLINQNNQPWKPKQTAIKDEKGKLVQGKKRKYKKMDRILQQPVHRKRQ